MHAQKYYGGRIMIKERKKIIALLAIVVILLAGGVGLGYYIWGMEKQEKPDHKKYLGKTIDYIAKIENANQTFIKQTKDFKTDISLLKKKVKEGQDYLESQSKSLQTKIVSIQNELDKNKASLQSALNENKKLALERDQLKARIAELVNEQEHPEMENHQTESVPLIEQEQAANDDDK
jgi:regulator of replication initiation timing